MERKTFDACCKALNEQGQGVAVIATLNAVDRDGDLTVPGAFGSGQVVPIVPAHNWQHVPLGKGRIREEGNEALVEFQLNMKLGLARAWYEHLKFDLETGPKQQWSYAFSIAPGGADSRDLGDGRRGRVLKRLQVHEVSPVLVGAGVNTRTLALKEGDAQEAALVAQTAAVVAGYERLLTKMVVQEFERSREKAQGQHAYKFVKFWASDQPYRTARSAAKHAASELGVKMPEIKVFTPCGSEDGDFTNDTKIVGYAHAGGWEIGVAANLMDERDIAWIAAHEVRHLAGGSEAEAEEFAEAFTAKVFGPASPRSKSGGGGGWTWDQASAVLTGMRGRGMSVAEINRMF